MSSPAAALPAPFPSRDAIPDRYKWDLSAIFPDDAAWRAACEALSEHIATYAALQGTLGKGPAHLLTAYRLDDVLGQLSYKIWFYVSLRHDEDQRDNAVGARLQEVQMIFARWRQAVAWMGPELLTIPLATVQAWMDADADLALYRFTIEEVYRQEEHVLDEKGERLLALSGRLSGSPTEAFQALSTADVKFPTITLRAGGEVQVTPGQLTAILTTNRDQDDRAAAYRAYHQIHAGSANTYAALYDGVLRRDWFHAQARGYATTLDAALHGNNIPASVVENLIATTRANVAPLQRYHRLRKRTLGLDHYGPYDGMVPLVDRAQRYPYEDVLDWIEASVAPLGPAYQRELRAAIRGRSIDVYESPGKRSGAYSAPVYGVHPYMLMNYNDTLDAVFTLAHEVGHTMHTILAHRHQPFVYAGYTIFVAEVPSTLNEALFLDYRMTRTTDPADRVVLLEHAIDAIVGTFYRQVLFADFELQAHRMVEQDQPITAETLAKLYVDVHHAYFGDTVELDPLTGTSWARVPHFFGSPYYVYQYATCYASSAALIAGITTGNAEERATCVSRYLELLAAGGSDHPMTLLRRAGVDLAQPEPVLAVVAQLDMLVTQLERDLAALGEAR